MNTFGDLRGTFAAVERINSVLSGTEIDEALAYGLDKEIQQKEVNNENIKLFLSNGSNGRSQYSKMHYMSALKSASSVCSVAWCGDVCLEGIFYAVLQNSLDTNITQTDLFPLSLNMIYFNSCEIT